VTIYLSLQTLIPWIMRSTISHCWHVLWLAIPLAACGLMNFIRCYALRLTGFAQILQNNHLMQFNFTFIINTGLWTRLIQFAYFLFCTSTLSFHCRLILEVRFVRRQTVCVLNNNFADIHKTLWNIHNTETTPSTRPYSPFQVSPSAFNNSKALTEETQDESNICTRN
jgi:hypothetical protein